MDESDGLENRCSPSSIFSEYRHETLTKQLPACYNSEAFSETTEGALFLPGAKDDRSPSSEGAFLVSETPHVGKVQGRGTGDGGGVLAESLGKSYPWAVG